MAGRFLGVGVDEYTDDSLPRLEHAVSDVRALQALLGSRFKGQPLVNPDEQSVRDGLSDLKGSMLEEAGELVLMWAGHGVPSLSVGLRLPARDSDSSKDEGFDVNGDLGSASGLSGAGQILLIIDTCYSGKAISAASVVNAIMQAQPPEGSYVWVGVLASCQTLATAQDGLFGQTLSRILKDGPTTPELKLRWSTQNEFIRGDDLCDAVLKEWDGNAQKPQFEGNGSAWWMFPNPLYRPNAPEQVVEHLLLAARGGARPDERSWFTGRTLEVDRVVGWVLSGQPGMHVVTGSAGSGKSAIVGRVVSLSNPQERERLLAEGRDWQHLDPGERSVQAHIHARGLTADRAADRLGDELVRCNILTPQPERRNASELIGQVQRAIESGKPLPVVVVDGLDEARGEAFSIAEDLLARLAEHAAVVVSTRELRRGDERESLTATLASHGAELDLDDPAIQERGRAAMYDYVAARLADVDERMDGAAVAEHLTREASMTSGSPFLLARLVTDRLRERPIDTSLAGWREQVSGSIDDALDADIARVTSRPGVDVSRAAHTAPATARWLLYALTWGLGAGVPEDEWLTVTHALRPDIGAGRDDVTWALDQLGRYVVQDGEDGVAVYRLAHQSLADHLRAPHYATRERPFDPDALPVAQALLGRYKTLLDGGVDARQPGYLWRYAWHHAALAGPSGLALLRSVAGREAQLAPDVGAAAALVAQIFGLAGRPHDVVPPAEEAVAVYRELARANPAVQSDLAMALNNLGACYGEVGRAHDALPPTEEAVAVYRELARANPAVQSDLAMALNNLGNRYSEVGRVHDAVPPAEEAVAIYRELVRGNVVFRGDLAMALNNLGNRYSEVGRVHDALPQVEEAVAIYRELARENPVFRVNIAGALNNLGNRYGEVGRAGDAVPLAEEAVSIYRELARENVVFQSDLAMALNNLGACYGEVGRAHDAVPLAEEAVEIYRELARENPVFRGNVAGSLNNLSACYSRVGRARDAVPPAEEAVAIYRELVRENVVFQGDLAMALNGLGNRYGEVGRAHDALQQVEEAAAIYRELVRGNVVFQGDLAMVLNNLGNRYSEVGRAHDAAPPVEEAVAIYRELVRGNVVFQGDLAMALNSLGNRYGEVGRARDAVPSAEEAVAIYRELARENPAFSGKLAGALNNLGNRYSEVDRVHDAVPQVEEAAAIYRELARESPVFQRDLAMALNNLGICYSRVGRTRDAVPSAEAAVDLYQELAGKDPAFLGRLGGALNNLASNLAAAGEPDRVDAAWDRVLGSFEDGANAVLILVRTQGADSREPRAVAWLLTAIARAGDDAVLLGALRQQARRHRELDAGAFDAEWERRAGEKPPAWLAVAPALVAAARAWIATATYTQERDYLAEHPELLAPDADLAVQEVLLGLADEESQRYTSLRQTARAEGVEVAYEPLLLTILAYEFMAGDADTQRRLLAQRRDELLGDSVRRAIGAVVNEQEDQLSRRALALLTLAARGDDTAALDALVEPSLFPALLRTLAERSDPAALAPAAFIALTAAAAPSQAAEACFFMAVAAAIAEEGDDATSAWLSQARTLDSEPAPAWIAQLAQLASKHPAVLPLIAQLSKPMDSQEDPLPPGEDEPD